MIVRTLPYADLLVRGDEALVLTHGQPEPAGDALSEAAGPGSVPAYAGTIARLSAIGVSVLELAAGGIDDEELARQLELRFGAPPQRSTKDAVAQVLAALAEQRLVGLE